jgi:hypothetical protein
LARPNNVETPAIVNATPIFVRDFAESIVRTMMNWNRAESWERVEDKLLRNSLVSNERLVLRAQDSQIDVQVLAIERIEELNATQAAQLAVDAIDSVHAKGRSFPYRSLARIVASHGSSEQKKRVLRHALTLVGRKGSELYGFISSLAEQARDDSLIPALKELLASQSPARTFALVPLMAWLSEDEALQLAKIEFDSGDIGRQYFAIKGLGGPDALWKRKFFMELDHSDINVRRLALDANILSANDFKFRVDCVRKLLPLLNNNDLPLRRGAAKALCGLCKLGYQLEVDINGVFRGQTNPSFLNGGQPLPETPGETDAFKAIRAGAEKWLKQNEK